MVCMTTGTEGRNKYSIPPHPRTDVLTPINFNIASVLIFRYWGKSVLSLLVKLSTFCSRSSLQFYYWYQKLLSFIFVLSLKLLILGKLLQYFQHSCRLWGCNLFSGVGNSYPYSFSLLKKNKHKIFVVNA